MELRCQFAIVGLTIGLLLAPIAECEAALFEAGSEGQTVVSSLSLHVPLAADRLKVSEKVAQDRSAAVGTRVEYRGLLAGHCYGGPLVTSRERAVLDLLAPTLQTGNICLQV